VLDVAPFRILAIQNTLEPNGQRRHRHLDKVTGVIDGLSQGRRQDDEFAAIRRGSILRNVGILNFSTHKSTLRKKMGFPLDLKELDTS